MEPSHYLHYPNTGNAVQVEVVHEDGHAITPHPVGVEDLLQQADHTMDLGEGIALRLEELNANQTYSDEDEDNNSSSGEEESDYAAHERGTQEGGRRSGGRPPVSPPPPPGTRATNDWYDVLDALRREQADVERTTAEVEASLRQPRESEGRLVTRNPNHVRSVATPLKRFSNVPSTASKSIAGEFTATTAVPSAPGASRRDVWASLAPPKDRQPHNYKMLRYVSFMGVLDYRRFRPTAVAFHAAASYVNRKDRGLRFLVYGGISSGVRTVEQELYEFSVLTGNWRRLEGRQLVPAGHYGHTMTVVEPLDRLVVIGGIGPGGATVSKETKDGWIADPLRAPRFHTLCPLLRRAGGGPAGSLLAVAKSEHLAPLSIGVSTRHASQAAASVGFVSLLFDMHLSDQTWRAIQPAQSFPLAYHTAVHFGTEIFVFGGLTGELRVSGQLLAIDPETYAVRLIQPDARSLSSSAKGRRGRSKSSDEKTATDDPRSEEEQAQEAAGPGPRFLHSAVRYGPYMIVYGGYNIHNEVLSDCWTFDMLNERWERLPCRGEPTGRAGHECCVVGCRMLVVGGFEASLDELSTRNSSSVAPMSSTVMELSLVPTTHGEHVWRESVRVHPAVPPLAFTRCVPCGDDHSLVLFGGLSQAPYAGGRTRSSASAPRRAASAKRRAPGSDSDEGEGSGDGGGGGDSEDDENGHAGHSRSIRNAGSSRAGHKSLLSRFTPFDDGLVFTFPVKRKLAKHAEGEPAVNALGVEIDPNELPEHFKTFVRRQEDFVKKKDAAASDTMRKLTLEEQEGMEPALYLTDAEIDLLLHRSEECCEAFGQRFPMQSLPSNIPDREERVHLIEECISESRQVRDVIKSMKGSEPGVTAVKSKTHRKRGGQKFEDYSAAKPFRRVVVMRLLEGINAHLAHMHRLNRALRTVEWDEKEGFLAAVEDMQNSVHAVSRAISGVMRKYIQHRVDSLMKGVDKHKEVMRQLTQVVEKNRHDKIWGVEEARDEQRQQAQRARAAVTSAAMKTRAPSSHNAASGGTQTDGNRGASSSKAGVRAHATSSRSRLGPHAGGWRGGAAKAVVYLMDKEWEDLRGRTMKVEKCAAHLQQYCQEGASAGGVERASAAPPPVAPPSAQQPFLNVPSLPLSQVSGAGGPSGANATGLAVPAPISAAALVVDSHAAPTEAGAAAVAGAARPQDVVVKHSNALRVDLAEVAALVGHAASEFYTALSEPPSKSGGARAAAAVRNESSADSLEAQLAPPQPPQQAAAAPVPATSHAQGSRSSSASSSSGSSTSSSSGSSSSSARSSSGNAAPKPLTTGTGLAPPPPVPGMPVPQQQLPVTAFLSTPPPHTQQQGLQSPPLMMSAVGQTPAEVAVHRAETTTSSPPLPKVQREEKQGHENVAAGTAEDVSSVTGHAVYLSSLEPILQAKESLLQMKEKVLLIRKNVWDSSDTAGAPQDTKAEELYRRLEKLVTAVAQSVTANFLTKAGARPARVRRPSSSVVGPVLPSSTARKPRCASSSSKGGVSAPAGGAASRRSSASRTAHQQKGRSSDLVAGAVPSSTPQPLSAPVTAAESASDAVRLGPLATVESEEGASWWKPTNPSAAASTSTNSATAPAAAPLVPLESVLQHVRLSTNNNSANAQGGGASSTASAAAAAAAQIQPVFQNVRTVPNKASGDAAYGVGGGLQSSNIWWTAAPPAYGSHSGGSTNVANKDGVAAVALSAVPKVVMPSSSTTNAATNAGKEEHPASVTPPPHRRATIAELTRLPSSAYLNGVQDASGGGDASHSAFSDNAFGASAREPVTSITGGNFAVNTEYLYRVAPQIVPAGVASNRDATLGPMEGEAAQNAWADVDDDYFYFGRLVESRVATAATAVSGPPYVSASLAAANKAPGRVGVSPAVGAVLGSQRVNAELLLAPNTSRAGGAHAGGKATSQSGSRPTLTRSPSSSVRHGAGGYQGTTVSQAQKAQTSRFVRKDGTKSSSFYTPGELQLMQARERLRSKPSKT